jgi:hypothetical protein
MQVITQAPARVLSCQGLKLTLSTLAVCAVVGVFAPAALAVTAAPLPTVALSGLPDHRVYEQVTPVDKNERDLLDHFNGYYDFTLAAPSGDSVVFQSQGAFADSVVGGAVNEYIATRGTDGWSSQATMPARDQESERSTIPVAFSPDLAYEVLTSASQPLAAGELSGGALNLYLRKNSDASYEALTKGAVAPPLTDYTSSLDAFSSDDSQILLENINALTANAPTEALENVYNYSSGEPTLVGVLPDGSVDPAGAVAGAGSSASVEHAMSEDGSRIYFTSPAAHPQESPVGQLYLRENALRPDAQTVKVSASQKTNGSGPGGTDAIGVQPAVYWDASMDGSEVFFTSPSELTNDAYTGSEDQGRDLYRYEANGGGLVDLTANHEARNEDGAAVESVIGASSDGSYVYFMASGQLTSDAPQGGGIYLWHGGATTFIATGGPSEGDQLGPNQTARVTPDGRHLAFMTGSDPLGTGSSAQQLYLYSADDSTLSCVSCAPNGATPVGDVFVPPASEIGGFNAFQSTPRYLIDDGSEVFFDSPNPLVPADTNGQMDAYEWHNGQLSLISSGQDSDASFFQDATADGRDVFFGTRQQLVAQDDDEDRDLYDAREGGGFPRPLTPPSCSGTGCQGAPPTPPVFATPASNTYNGIGNFAPVKPSVATKPRAKPLSRAQKLTRALKDCRSQRGKRRAGCEARARKSYGPVHKAKKTNRRGN